MNRNMKVISIALFAVLAISSVIYALGGQVENASPNRYGIEYGEIIAEIPNDNSIDVIVKENDNAIFYTYEESEVGRRYKKILEFNSDNYFSYQGRKNAMKHAGELRTQIQLTSKLYDGIYEGAERKPYWGVSISQSICNLKVNNHSVDKIIEYKEGKHTFYIWYFSNLEIDYADVEVNI